MKQQGSQKKNQNYIFGVSCGYYTRKDLYEKIEMAFSGFSKVAIVTLNPEILLQAKEDENYRNIINNAEIKIIDGFGIRLVGRLKGMKIGQRITGVDFAEHLLKKAKKAGMKMGIVLWEEGLSSREDLQLVMDNLGIKNAFIYSIGLNEECDLDPDIELLLVGLGAPHQEKFIDRVSRQLPKLKISIGVGGTFDFWTGKQKRAPGFLRGIGLEWLWRGVTQPQRKMARLKRVSRAVIIFLFLSFKDKNKKKNY